MRKLLIFLFTVTLFTACNNNKDDRRAERERDDYRSRNKEEDDNNNDPGREDKWSSGDISAFNRDCEESMAEANLDREQLDQVCSCLLEKFQDRYSSYADLEENASEDEGEKAAIQLLLSAGEECLGNIRKTGDDDNNGGGGWTRSDQQQWMDDCESSIGSKMSKENRYDYCWCVMEKLERRYSNYDKMNREGTQQEGIDLGIECKGKLGLE